MAYSVVPRRQQRSLDLRWTKASDPAPYKGCIIFLLTLYQLCCLQHYNGMLENGGAHLWWLVRRGEVWVSRRSSAVLMTSSLVQFCIQLCGDVYLYSGHDDVLSSSGDAAILMFSPSSGHQFSSHALWTRGTHFLPFPGFVVVLVPYLIHMAACLWRYVQQCSRPDPSTLCHSQLGIQKSYHFPVLMKLTMSFTLQCCIALLLSSPSSSSSLAFWKCVKKRVAEAMTWTHNQLHFFRGRAALRLGTLIVFVNEMLLMMAGDVEPNPGPGNLGPNDLRAVRRALFSVRSKWYDIGKGLDISPQTLKDIGREYPNNTPACLTKMLKQWLSSTSPLEWHTPPSWNSLVRALLSVPIGEKKLAYDIWKQYCYQDGEQATGPAPVTEKSDGEHKGWKKGCGRGKGRETEKMGKKSGWGRGRGRGRGRSRTQQCEATTPGQPLRGISAVQADISHLDEDFISLRNATREELEKAGVSAESLLDAIYDLPTAKKAQHREFLMKYEKHFSDCENIRSVFRKLSTYWNYMNIDILAHLITKFSFRCLYAQLEAYEVKLDHFMEQTTIMEYYEVEGDKAQIQPPEGFIELVREHNWEQTIYLKGINDFRKKFAHEFDLHTCVLILIGIMNIG